MKKNRKTKQSLESQLLTLRRAYFIILFIVSIVAFHFVFHYFIFNLFAEIRCATTQNYFLAFIVILITATFASIPISFFIRKLQVSRQRLSISRERLRDVVLQLKKAHLRDLELTSKLQENIETLNQEIITRKKTEEELAQNASLLRAYIDLSPDLIFRRNEDNQFIWCNNSTATLLGRTESELIGLTPLDVYPEDIAQKILDSDKTVLRYNATVTIELWLSYPNGHLACFEVKKTPFYENGFRQGLIGFGRDITEHKSYENLLKKANREKTTFISTISHELRTPLNAIIGLSRMQLDSDLSGEQREYQETIYASAVMLSVILNDVIELDRLEQKKIKINSKPVSKESFLGNLENIARTMVKAKNISLSLDIEPTAPPALNIDETRFNQILWNIIHNAVKFTPENGQIWLKTWYDQKHSILYFSVTDTGIGIPKKELDKIFTMYYQVKNHHMATGTGIGLAISKRIAQTMGGDIRVQSRGVNKGTTFTISIKATQPTEKDYQDNTQSEATTLLHILLVEDIELNILVAKSVLEKLGHTVDVAKTGEETLAKFEPNVYDLILLDVQLPDISGLEIANELHHRYKKEELPHIVAFTANTFRNKQEYLDAGIDDIINKPLSINDLNKIINRFWPPEGESVKTIKESQDDNAEQGILNYEALKQYVDLVGQETMLESSNMFENVMPGYVETLSLFSESIDSNNPNDENLKKLSQEAHKIKGAAGSLGLLHIQQVAHQIEKTTLPTWFESAHDWIDEIRNTWRSDLEMLRTWIKNQK